MKKLRVIRWMLAAIQMAVLLSGCNFPVLRAGTQATPGQATGNAAPTRTAAPPATETAIPSATSTALPANTPTSTATNPQTAVFTAEVTATLPLTAAPTNTLVPTPTRYLAVSIRGTAMVEKNMRMLPIGGAGVSLYDDQRGALIASTNTNIEGGFQINELSAGKYYLVLVWIIKSSGWPCAKSSLPDHDRKDVWDYVVHGLAHHVQIQNRGDDTYVVSIGTGAFSFAGRKTEQIEIYLKCNALN